MLAPHSHQSIPELTEESVLGRIVKFGLAPGLASAALAVGGSPWWLVCAAGPVMVLPVLFRALQVSRDGLEWSRVSRIWSLGGAAACVLLALACLVPMDALLRVAIAAGTLNLYAYSSSFLPGMPSYREALKLAGPAAGIGLLAVTGLVLQINGR